MAYTAPSLFTLRTKAGSLLKKIRSELSDIATALPALTGTTETTFQIDSDDTGPKIKNSSGVLEVRNEADDAYADLKAKDVTGDSFTGNVTGNLTGNVTGDLTGDVSQAASTDLAITGPTGQDVIIKTGDNAGANKISVVDSDAAEVVSIDSDGLITGVGFAGPLTGTVTGNVTGDLTGDVSQAAATGLLITGSTGEDVILKLGDNAGANKLSVADSDDAEVVSINSDGLITGVGFAGPLTGNVAGDLTGDVTQAASTDLALTGPTGQDVIIKTGDNAGANKISVIDSDAAEVVSIDSDGLITAVGFAGPLTGTTTGQHIQNSATQTATTGDISASTGLTMIDTTSGAQALGLPNATVAGTELNISMTVDGAADSVVTPTTLNGYTTITLNDVGDTIQLIWVTTLGWTVKYNQGCNLA